MSQSEYQGAYNIHKLGDKELKGQPTFRQKADEILAFMDGCDLLTHNGNSFDIPFLQVSRQLPRQTCDAALCGSGKLAPALSWP